MSPPQRNPDQTAISVSMPKSLLAQIDARAEALALTRSQYLAQLARNDLSSRGDLVLREGPATNELSSPAASCPSTMGNLGKLKSVAFPKTSCVQPQESAEAHQSSTPVAAPVHYPKARNSPAPLHPLSTVPHSRPALNIPKSNKK